MTAWAYDFYAAQRRWGVYTADIHPHHHAKLALVHQLTRSAPQSVLELGAGGGQMAVVTSLAGHTVTAIELVPQLAEQITELARAHETAVEVIAADFYTVDLAQQVDLVVYHDGFGIGRDSDQQRLLQRIAGWLKPTGCALLDVYTPWHWAKAHDVEMSFKAAGRRYTFDADGCRMLDTWWGHDDPALQFTQSLRCYSPADLRLLLADTGLILTDIHPLGSMDYTTMTYHEQAPLHEAMQYVAKLAKI